MRKNSTAVLVLSALMCALVAVLSQLQIPLPPVPLSLALLGVHLCGVLLPGRWGAAAVGAYVLLGALGVPVYAGFSGGPSVLLGPTGGFLFGYALCAALEGALIRRLGFSRRTLAAAMLSGTAVCYALGAMWFAAVTGSGAAQSLAACVLPFLPGDAVKIALAVTLALRLQKTLAVQALSR